MIEKFKILANFIKDMSSETPDIQSYIYVKDNISKYHLNIDITSKAVKNKMIEVSTTLRFEDKGASERKSHFEIIYISIVIIHISYSIQTRIIYLSNLPVMRVSASRHVYTHTAYVYAHSI